MNRKILMMTALLVATLIMPMATHGATDASGEVITHFKDTAQFSDRAGNEMQSPVHEAWPMIVVGCGIVGLAGWGRRKFRKL